jgi:transcriptional regulator with XRE-family HTH domain
MAARKEPGAEEFGRLLAARRHELGLSRREVAEASGLSYPYVSQLETGYRLPSHKAIAALAEALELDPGELSASIPYEASMSSPRSLRAARPARARVNDEGWYANPDYAIADVAGVPEPSERVARQIAELVGELPKEQRLDVLNAAQRMVMDDLVAEELQERRGR